MKSISIDNLVIHFLALLIHWNIITGLAECIDIIFGSNLVGMSAFLTRYISLFFIGITCFIIIYYGTLDMSMIFGMIYGFFLIISLIIEPGIETILSRAIIYYVLNVFCVAYLLSRVSDLLLLWKDMNTFIFIALLYALAKWAAFSVVPEYDMSFSYAITVPALVSLINSFYKNRNRSLYLIVFGVFCVINLKCGSRGCFLCFLIAFMFIFLFLDYKRKAVVASCAAVLFFTLTVLWDRICEFLLMHFPTSRSIHLLSTGMAFYGASRGKYYTSIISCLKKQPFRFRGLYADRIYLSKLFHVLGKEGIWGSYSHNILIELLFQFGLAMLPIVIVGFIIFIRTTIRLRKEQNMQLIAFFIVSASYAIGQLMISSSYLISPSFGLICGFFSLYYKKAYFNSSKYAHNDTF